MLAGFNKVSNGYALSCSSRDLLALYKGIYMKMPILYWDIVLGEMKHFEELSKQIGFYRWETLYETYHAWVLESLILFPFVKEALICLKSDHHDLFILSNGRQINQEFKLQYWGIKKFFSAIYTSEKIQLEKPNILAFSFLLEQEDLDVKETWMIWDSIDNDIIPAENLWIRTLLFNEKKLKDWFILWKNGFTSYKNLPWMLRSLTKK